MYGDPARRTPDLGARTAYRKETKNRRTANAHGFSPSRKPVARTMGRTGPEPNSVDGFAESQEKYVAIGSEIAYSCGAPANAHARYEMMEPIESWYKRSRGGAPAAGARDCPTSGAGTWPSNTTSRSVLMKVARWL